MQLLFGMLLLDKVFGDGNLLDDIVSSILLFIGIIIYLIAMWKVVGYIETNLLSYSPIIGAAAIGLTYTIPRFKDESTFLRGLVFKLLIIVNIGVCFVLYFTLTQLLGEGLATLINNNTLVPISELLVSIGFPFSMLGAFLMIISSLLATTFDLIVLPFTLVPFIQKIIWNVMSVNFEHK